MKKTIYPLALMLLVSGAMMSSCDNAAKKEAEARENLQEAKEELREEVRDEVNSDEWTTFKTETELKIKANEVRIAELKLKLQKPGKVLDPLYSDAIKKLEKRNEALRARIENYDVSKSDWKKFQIEFKHDMDELGQALKDLSVDNTK